MYEFLVYVMVLIAVIWTLDGINFNGILKKNKVAQAKVFYMMIIFSLTYLVSNFIIGFLTALK